MVRVPAAWLASNLQLTKQVKPLAALVVTASQSLDLELTRCSRSCKQRAARCWHSGVGWWWSARLHLLAI